MSDVRMSDVRMSDVRMSDDRMSDVGLVNVHRAPELAGGLTSPDVYFTPGYGLAAADSDGGDWALLEAFDGAWQVPLIVRTLDDGTKDAISPYGYSGVYASPSLSPAALSQAWAATVSTLREQGVISVLLRHSPIVPQARDLPGLRPIISGHPTIVLEQADDDSVWTSDSAWTGMEPSCRNKTRKALKNGYTGEVRPTTMQDLASGSDFRRLYEQTMQRRAAASPYFFTDDYYEALVAGLGANLLICEVRSLEGKVVSSTLLMRHDRRLHYHLAGSNVDDARQGSNNLMLWTAAQFAIAQGLGQFHLGGGVSARDGLFSFKKSFGGRELEYGVSGSILDERQYEVQVAIRAKECDTTSEALQASGFFPAYRAGAG